MKPLLKIGDRVYYNSAAYKVIAVYKDGIQIRIQSILYPAIKRLVTVGQVSR